MWNQDSIAKSIWQVLHRIRVVSFIEEELGTFNGLKYIMNSQKRNMAHRVPNVFDLGFFSYNISRAQCILECVLEMWLDNILTCQLVSLFWIYFISMMFLWRGVPTPHEAFLLLRFLTKVGWQLSLIFNIFLGDKHSVNYWPVGESYTLGIKVIGQHESPATTPSYPWCPILIFPWELCT